MKHKKLLLAVCLLVAFALWTTALSRIDVQAIGPQDSTVGFAAVNQFVHALTGVHWFLYVLTDWLSLIPVGFMAGFALLGLVQWIRRKSLWKVDRSILALGGFYLVVAAVFLFFETVVINYRPVLIAGVLEASYPSSTTMLVLCVMPTAAMQLRSRIRNSAVRGQITAAIVVFTVFMVLARLISGVHWVTDIVGGTLASAGLVLLYAHSCDALQ
jgi:undecaprenyl-diphosphatase